MSQPVLLDYRRPANRGRRRLAWPSLAFVLLIAAAAVGAGLYSGQRSLERARRAGLGPADGGRFVIDCSVPGTEVFLRNQLLGTVPVSLSGDDFARLGIPLTSASAAGPAQFDGCGEGIFFGEQDERETRVMFRVPDAVAHHYLSIETPWGRRTRTTGSGHANRALVRPQMMLAGSQGLVLSLACPGRVSRDEDRLTVEACITNLGYSAYDGVDPVMVLQWGAFDTPWRRRTTCNLRLPSEWSHIKPGQTLNATVEIPAPSVSSDYSLFATFAVGDPSVAGRILKGDGLVYSDSVLLRVR